MAGLPVKVLRYRCYTIGGEYQFSKAVLQIVTYFVYIQKGDCYLIADITTALNILSLSFLLYI